MKTLVSAIIFIVLIPLDFYIGELQLPLSLKYSPKTASWIMLACHLALLGILFYIHRNHRSDKTSEHWSLMIFYYVCFGLSILVFSFFSLIILGMVGSGGEPRLFG